MCETLLSFVLLQVIERNKKEIQASCTTELVIDEMPISSKAA